MEYGYQKVLEVQRRCGVSFEDADKALKVEKGDVDKACVYAMRKKKNSEELKKVGSFSNFLTYRIKISKNGKDKFDISMGIVLLVSLIVLIFSSAFDEGITIFLLYLCIFLITVFTGYTLSFMPDDTKKETKLEAVSQDEIVEEAIEIVDVEDDVELEGDGFNTIEIE